MEEVLAKQKEEILRMEATLVQANEDLQHWFCLLAEQQSNPTSLVAALNQAREDFKNEKTLKEMEGKKKYLRRRFLQLFKQT